LPFFSASSVVLCSTFLERSAFVKTETLIPPSYDFAQHHGCRALQLHGDPYTKTASRCSPALEISQHVSGKLERRRTVQKSPLYNHLYTFKSTRTLRYVAPGNARTELESDSKYQTQGNTFALFPPKVPSLELFKICHIKMLEAPVCTPLHPPS
jgi:hypothetical protein